jgi:hypothetical protein
MPGLTHGRRRRAGKLAVAAILAGGTVVGFTHAAFAGSVCSDLSTSCLITPTVPLPTCTFDIGRVTLNALPPSFNWAGAGGSC